MEGWTLPGGTRLHNTGSWLHEEVFLGDLRDARNPYWPGWVTYVSDEGPPQLSNFLEGWNGKRPGFPGRFLRHSAALTPLRRPATAPRRRGRPGPARRSRPRQQSRSSW